MTAETSGTPVAPGRRLGVDTGSVRVGVAVSDPAGLLATPLETVRRGPGDLARLASLAVEHEVVAVVVGLPRSLSGKEGAAAAAARNLAKELAALVAPIPVRLVDERLTTVSALRDMRSVGVSSRRGRERVDQAAAVVILQHALDSERAGGKPAGQIVRVD